jgi:hypothetical protein
MNRIVRMGALVVALVGAPAIASGRAPAEQVRVEADEIGTMGRKRLDAIAVEATKLAEQAGIAPDQMSVSIVWADRDAIVYGIRVRIVTDAAKVADPADERGPIVHRCNDCNTDDLVTATVEGVLEAIQLYKEAQEPEPAAREPEPEPADAQPQPQPPPPVDAAPVDRAGGLGAVGKAGVAAIVIGASAVVAGGALVGVGTTRPSADPTRLREFRPTGYAVLGVGAAVLVTGIALLAVDRTKAKRATTMVPLLSPGFIGVSARARF